MGFAPISCVTILVVGSVQAVVEYSQVNKGNAEQKTAVLRREIKPTKSKNLKMNEREAYWAEKIERHFNKLEKAAKSMEGNSKVRSCDTELTVPNPFGRAHLDTTYDDEIHPPGDHGSLQQMFRKFSQNVEDFAEDCEARKSLSRLLQDGLVLSHFGMDFTEVLKTRYPSGRGLATDVDVQKMRDIYFATRVNNFFWDVDVPAWYAGMYQKHVGYSSQELELLASFRRDGFVKIDEWPGLNIAQVHEEAQPGLSLSQLHVVELGAHEAVHGSSSLLQRRMEGVEEPMLHPDSLMMKLSRAYLGGEPIVNNVAPFSLKGSATKKEYSNAPWHHDGCGTRLKAWIYLNDVDEHTHPTLIAAGTHQNQYYPTNQYFVGEQGHNKLSEAMVQKEFSSRITPMLGKRGGGFIFDTNCLHSANMKGIHKDRNVILIEMSTAQHKDGMPRGPRGSDDDYMSGFVSGLCPSQGDR
jgi:hypothetical protein